MGRRRAGVAAILTMATALTGCSERFWARPDTPLPTLARDAEGCYRRAVAAEAAALPGPDARRGPLLLTTEPPPAVWERAPASAGFTRFDEQLRYEACMTERGYRTARTRPAPWPFGR